MENTMPLEDSPRLIDVATETQVLGESMRTQLMSEAYNDTVVNSDNTESNTTEVLEDVDGSSDHDTPVSSGTHTANQEITINNNYQQPNATPNTSASVRKRFTSVRTASLRASGLAAHKIELSGNNNRHSSPAAGNCEVSEFDGKPAGVLTLSASLCVEDREKGTEGYPRPENTNGWSKKLFPETELAGLSYVHSQEPGEASQANALELVDRLLMVSVLETEEEASRERETASRKSGKIPPVKGTQSVAKKRSGLGISGKSRAFDWDNSREDEGGGDIFCRRREDFFVGTNRPGKSKHVLSKGRVNVHEKIMKIVHSELGVSQEKSQLRKSLTHDLPGDLAGPLDENIEADDEILDVGFDTQMAAEAMEVLSNGPPLPMEEPGISGVCAPTRTKRKPKLSRGKALSSTPRRKPRTTVKPKTTRKHANPKPEKRADPRPKKQTSTKPEKRADSNPKQANLNPEKQENPNPKKRVNTNLEKWANPNPEKHIPGVKYMEDSDSIRGAVALRTRQRSAGTSGRGGGVRPLLDQQNSRAKGFNFSKKGEPWEFNAEGKRLKQTGPDSTIIQGKRTRRVAAEKVEKERKSVSRVGRSELADDPVRSDIGQEASCSGGGVGMDGNRMMNPCAGTGLVSASAHSVKVGIQEDITRVSGSACVSPVISSTPVVADSPVCKGNEYLWLNLLSTGYPKGSRRRRDMASVRVVFSHHLDDDVVKQQKKILARLGASEVSSMMDGTHFIADRFVRTKNMLEAIALGKPVVTHLWLENCGQVSCFIDEKNCILRDGRKEKEIGFSMPMSLHQARQNPLLKGRRILITPSTKPGKEVISGLVKAVHGEAVERIGRSRLAEDLLILSCEEDRSTCLPYIQKGAAVYSSELLLNGIIIQKLEFERHQLFLASHL